MSDRGNLSIAAPLLKNELGISASQLGILLSSFFWTYTACLFFCGWFADHLDVSSVLGMGFLLWSLATAATGFVHGFVMLLLMRLILGMGESVAFPSYCKILARHLPEQYCGFANGAIIGGMKLGPAAISLLWLPAWMKWRPRYKADAGESSFDPAVAEILRQRTFWADTSASFCAVYPLYFILTWLPFYLAHEQHLPLSQMVKVTALYYAVDGAVSLVTGWFSDFFLARGAVATRVRKSAMALGWTTAAVGFSGCAWASAHSYLAGCW
jgi:MFS transporter, ACS family, D-galactonate transporter